MKQNKNSIQHDSIDKKVIHRFVFVIYVYLQSMKKKTFVSNVVRWHIWKPFERFGMNIERTRCHVQNKRCHNSLATKNKKLMQVLPTVRCSTSHCESAIFNFFFFAFRKDSLVCTCVFFVVLRNKIKFAKKIINQLAWEKLEVKYQKFVRNKVISLKIHKKAYQFSFNSKICFLRGNFSL